MNRKNKSLIILGVVLVVLIPLGYAAIQALQKIDAEMQDRLEEATEMLEERQSMVETMVIGYQWENMSTPNELWAFHSNTQLFINQTQYDIQIESGTIIIVDDDVVRVGTINNDSNLSFTTMGTELKNMTDTPKTIKLQRIGHLQLSDTTAHD
ncbi:MAG: hypothetical protein KC456_01285 [Flavobacteriales bacterium]|jgi:hypothetical protein|nr:hypothetical protein [Flavobacteriales bacterium]